MDVTSWLEDLGFGQYGPAFAANEIDQETLLKLTPEDLKELGVAALGHRKKILDAISALNAKIGSIHVGLTETPELEPRDSKSAQNKPREAERRQLTVVFVDLVGSTGLATQLDPEEMSVLLRQFQNAVAGEIVRFDGYVAKLMGDGVLAYFGWPQAHEDEAERSVRAGLAVVSTVGAMSTKDGSPLSVRVGIATGLVVVGDLIGVGAAQELAVVGETPNLAARLQEMAEPGTVLISELTYRLIGRLFEVTRVRPQKLHGFDTPTNSYQVLSENAVESRFDALHPGGAAPLAGRDIDISLLLERWKLARSGEGQVIELFGEGGIGKSRLLQELRDRLKEEPITHLRYFCSPYHTQTELYPVAEQLLRAAAIKRSDPPERQLAFLEQVLSSTPNPHEAVPLIANMLSIPVGPRYAKLDLMPQMQRTLDIRSPDRSVRGASKEQSGPHASRGCSLPRYDLSRAFRRGRGSLEKAANYVGGNISARRSGPLERVAACNAVDIEPSQPSASGNYHQWFDWRQAASVAGAGADTLENGGGSAFYRGVDKGDAGVRAS